jgi:hypothetical protein
MFADYKSLVFLDYQRKMAANALSLNLIRPTSARLKAECLSACDERYLRKDEKALKAFFGQGSERVSCLQAIGRCETDRFKPLVNFLRKPTIKTEDKNIELLAWLIDFEHRPYELGRKYESNSLRDPGIKKEELQENCNEKEEDSIRQSEENREKTMPFQIGSDQAGTKLKIRNIIVVGMMFASISVVIYWIWNNKKSTVALSGHEACMYWAGDHYQQVSCNQKIENTLVIALDSEKINHFRKITQPDTITQRSKGIVWYVKVNGNIEFYTSGGDHPVHSELRLRPITDYIIRKYIHSGEDSGQASQ